MNKARSAEPPRKPGKAMRRGAVGRCPDCGVGPLFEGFLTLRDACVHCGLVFERHAPAAGPAFLSIAIAGALIVPLMSIAAAIFGPDPVILATIGFATVPLIAVLLLRITKGAMVGYLWVFDTDSGRKGNAGRK